MIRRVGTPPERGRKYILRPGAYAILPLQGRFLMTAEMQPMPDVQLPGGGIDPGESPLQALHREVLEEIGWRITAPRRLGAFRRFTFMPEYDLWAEKLCHVFVARPTHQIALPTEPNHRTLVLTADEAIAVLGNDGDRTLLQRYLSVGGPVYSKRLAETSSGKT
ncbi:NUDIX domain-containing protein [Sulfitobacter sp. JB4-11]|uniref:NUDIX domain-containing protein n=1 Tax=Sulfitobacter rhodophyticola TaxID=3238304 RepID=UPI0035122BD3